MDKAILLAIAASVCTATASLCQRKGAKDNETAGFDAVWVLRAPLRWHYEAVAVHTLAATASRIALSISVPLRLPSPRRVAAVTDPPRPGRTASRRVLL